MKNTKKEQQIIYEVLLNFLSVNKIKVLSFDFYEHFYCVALKIEYEHVVYEFVHDKGDIYCNSNGKLINCFHVEKASDIVSELIIAFSNAITKILLSK